LPGDVDDYSRRIQIHASTDLDDEQRELEEDLALMRRKVPQLEGMPESQKPTSWYPGCRRVERMKQAWAAADRKRSVPPPDAQQIVSSDQRAVSGREWP
jgi:hypothetical protein